MAALGVGAVLLEGAPDLLEMDAADDLGPPVGGLQGRSAGGDRHAPPAAAELPAPLRTRQCGVLAGSSLVRAIAAASAAARPAHSGVSGSAVSS